MRRLSGLLLAIAVCGCAGLKDLPANVAGFSTQELERSRAHSVYRSYPCDMADCFGAVVTAAEEKGYTVFSKDASRGLIVLMGVPGFVDTTEVGIFLSALSNSSVKVEVASMSSPARRAVAQAIFGRLNDLYMKKDVAK